MKKRISSELFLDYLKCQYKVYLKSDGRLGTVSDYQKLEVNLKRDYAATTYKKLLNSHPAEQISVTPKSIINAIKNRYILIIKAHADVDNLSVHFDAINFSKENLVLKYQPILFVYREKIHKQDMLHLAFCGLVLAKLLNCQARYGRIIRGRGFTSTKVNIEKLFPSVEQILLNIVRIINSKSPPKILLNDNCKVCEFDHYCSNIARSNDDLSLLKGISRKEIIKLNQPSLCRSGRCKFHGGLSTGPKTEEGKRKSAENGFKSKLKRTP